MATSHFSCAFVALATYLQALGLSLDADRVNSFLATTVIECDGGLSLAVGMALSEERAFSGEPREDFGERASGAVTTSANQAPADRSIQMPRSPSPKPQRSARDGLLELLANAKGPPWVCQEGLAEALGVTSARVRQALGRWLMKYVILNVKGS